MRLSILPILDHSGGGRCSRRGGCNLLSEHLLGCEPTWLSGIGGRFPWLGDGGSWREEKKEKSILTDGNAFRGDLLVKSVVVEDHIIEDNLQRTRLRMLQTREDSASLMQGDEGAEPASPFETIDFLAQLNVQPYFRVVLPTYTENLH